MIDIWSLAHKKVNLSLIKSELDLLPKYENQIYLQGDTSNMDPIEPTIGDKYLYVDDNEILYDKPLFDIPYINAIIKKYDLVRTRVIRMKKKTCYYYHKDNTKRLHIPIITNENCFLLVDEKLIHLPANGKTYIVDTTKMHTALNASKFDRIHIIGAFRV